ncbi:MAG: hypothetical protein AAGE52_18635 [Myxococcota bacterium]
MRWTLLLFSLQACALSHETCRHEGEAFATGETYALPGECGVCECQEDGTFTCERDPDIGCNVCFDEGGTGRARGERWSPGPCAECVCEEGGSITCDVAECRGCVGDDGRRYSVGEGYAPSECTFCQCLEDGTFQCEGVPGCMGVCVDDRGRSYLPGEGYGMEECPFSHCTCLDDGTFECEGPAIDCAGCTDDDGNTYAIGEGYALEGCPGGYCSCTEFGTFDCLVETVECPVCFTDGGSYYRGEACRDGCSECTCEADGSLSCVTPDFCPVCEHDGEMYEPGAIRADSCSTCTCTLDGWVCPDTAEACLGICSLPSGDWAMDQREVVTGEGFTQTCQCFSDGNVRCWVEGNRCMYEGRGFRPGDVIEVEGFEAGCTSHCLCGEDGSFTCGHHGTCPPHVSVGDVARSCTSGWCHNCVRQPDGRLHCDSGC